MSELEQVQEAQEEISRENRREASSMDLTLKTLMALPLMRKWMWSFISSTNVFSNVFTDNVQITYLLGGERNVGIRLLGDLLRVCPEEYKLMVQENQK